MGVQNLLFSRGSSSNTTFKPLFFNNLANFAPFYPCRRKIRPSCALTYLLLILAWGLVACSAVTVSDPPSSAILVIVSPTSASIAPSSSIQISGTASGAVNQGVTWSVTGAGCSGAACGTLSNITASSVSYTAPAAVPSPATVTVKATSVADVSKSTTVSITVTAASGSITVSVTPRLAAVTVSQPQQFVATVSGDPNNLGVSWAVDGNPGGNLSGG